MQRPPNEKMTRHFVISAGGEIQFKLSLFRFNVLCSHGLYEDGPITFLDDGSC